MNRRERREETQKIEEATKRGKTVRVSVRYERDSGYGMKDG
jgi:hypothetical protein